jgi:hypothetical protein
MKNVHIRPTYKGIFFVFHIFNKKLCHVEAKGFFDTKKLNADDENYLIFLTKSYKLQDHPLIKREQADKTNTPYVYKYITPLTFKKTLTTRFIQKIMSYHFLFVFITQGSLCLTSNFSFLINILNKTSGQSF